MLLRAVRLLISLVVLSFVAGACQPIDPAKFGGAAPPLTSTPAPSSQPPNTSLATRVQDGVDQAHVYNKGGRYYASLPILEGLLALDLPDALRAQVLVERSTTHRARNDYAVAAADLLEAFHLGAEPDGYNLNNLCWSLGLLGRAEEALPYCEQAVAADPRPLVRDSRGLALAQVGRYGEALDDFQSYIDTLLTSGPEYKQSEREQREGWVEQLKRSENPFTVQVLADLRGVMLPTLTADDAAAAQQVTDGLDQATAYIRFDRYDIALGILNGLLAMELPDILHGEVLAVRGDEDIHLNDYEAAVVDLGAALALGVVDAAEVSNNLCRSLALLERADEALPYCEQAVIDDPTPTRRDSRGLALAQLGHFKEAQADFQAWLDANLSLREYFETECAQREAWVSALSRGENPLTAEALANLRGERITITPRPAPSAEPPDVFTAHDYVAAARMAFNMGDTEGAEETLKLAFETDPESPQAFALRAELRLARGDTESAMSDADLLVTMYEAVGEPPVLAHYLRAQVFATAGDMESALKAVETALAAASEHPRDDNAQLVQQMQLVHGILLIQNGKDDAAIVALGEFIDHAEPGPDLTTAHALRGRAYYLHDNLEEARPDLEAALAGPGLPEDWAAAMQAMLDEIPSTPGASAVPSEAPDEGSSTTQELFVTIASGALHMCATMPDGALRCQGDNRAGQLGDGTTADRVGLEFEEGQSGPAATHGMADAQGLGGPVVEIVLGAMHSCARLEGGAVQCWGDNSAGELGDGTKENRSAPVNVGGLPPAIQDIGSGVGHVCAVDTEGAVWCWGWGEKGQLGDGAIEDRATPVRVEGLPPARQVVGGNTHSCAVLQTGGVMCWGSNQFGQLGDGTGISSTVPVMVTGLESGVRSVYAGTGMSWALLEDGSVKAWGLNETGELGDGTTNNRLVPVDVIGLGSRAVGLAGAYYHACALLEAGAVKCWGKNDRGQVSYEGMMTLPNATPIEIHGFAGPIDSLSAGLYHTCALLRNGRLECWGMIP